MMKIDVAVQSFNKPESLIYTLLTLKKHSGDYIDTIYINDDCSNVDINSHYFNPMFLEYMSPIKIELRINKKPTRWSKTIFTKKMFKKRNIINKIRLITMRIIKKSQFHSDENDIRYQWAINSSTKRYLLIIHDDIKITGDIVSLYIDQFIKNKNLIICGDFAGSNRCPYGPCGEKTCSAKKILEGYRPSTEWPVTGSYGFIHTMFGRKKRNCRINEWCCMIDVDKTRKISRTEEVHFGNYEFGGDISCFWFDRIISKGFDFTDPLAYDDKNKYYIHCWQGFEGHSVWCDYGSGLSVYNKEFILNKIKEEFKISI